MLFSSLLVSLLMASANAIPEVFKRQQNCNRDNCNRAVVRRGDTGVSDCNSYFATTSVINPVLTVDSGIATESTATVTTLTIITTRGVTVTTTSTTLIVTAGAINKRQGPDANATPSYAAACAGDVSRYSSACSCVGASGTVTTVDGGTLTLPTLTSTIVSVNTITETSTTPRISTRVRTTTTTTSAPAP